MLRIDESSKTLVAPQDGGFVTEVHPDRAELLELLGNGGWAPFSHELGLDGLIFVAREPQPGVDILAVDETSGSCAVVVLPGGSPLDQLARGLAAAAEVASWDAQDLAEVDEAIEAAAPGESPRIILVAGHWDESALITADWLVGSHDVDLSCYALQVLRFGGERLVSVRREFPPAADAAPDAAVEVERLLAEAAAPAGNGSTPPPAS